MRRTLLALVVLGTMASTTHAQDRPAHPAVRYACMSDPPEGYAWPWVAAGVPYALEVQHPGYGIADFDAFTISGVRLFVIAGMRRADDVSERYADVEGVDESGAVLRGRALFLRASVGVTDADAMARRAMAILMRRADERPLRAAFAGASDLVRDRIGPPAIVGRTLTFWIRNRADQPYASLVTVDMDTGTLSGDPG